MTVSERFRSARTGLLWALLATTVSIACGAIGLSTASGVERISDTSYRTEFIHPAWLLTSFLSLLAVGFAARIRLWAGLVGTVGAATGSLWAITVAMQRYQQSDWASGLEVFGYLHSIGLAVGGVAITVVLALITRFGRPR